MAELKDNFHDGQLVWFGDKELQYILHWCDSHMGQSLAHLITGDQLYILRIVRDNGTPFAQVCRLEDKDVSITRIFSKERYSSIRLKDLVPYGKHTIVDLSRTSENRIQTCPYCQWKRMGEPDEPGWTDLCKIIRENIPA
jgi:hypothetical protein